MSLYAIVKKSDQDFPGRQNQGLKEGMINYWHDTDTMGPIDGPLGLSAWMKTVYFAIEISTTYKEDVKDWVQLIYSLPGAEGILIRKRAYALDLPALCQELDPTLYARLGGPDVVEPISIKHLGDLRDKMKPSELIDYSKIAVIKDLNAITSGSHNVGVAQPYANWSAFEGDQNPLIGLITGLKKTNITETAAVTFNVDTNGYNIVLDSDSDHLGDPTSGWVTSIAHNSFGLRASQTDGGRLFVQNFLAKRTTAASSDVFAILLGNSSSSLLTVRDMLVDGNSLTGKGVNIQATALHQIYNSKIWDVPGIGLHIAGTGISENNVVYSGGTGVECTSGQSSTIRNTMSFSNTTDFVNPGDSVGENNADVDGTGANANWSTGTNNKPNLTAADEVDSLDDTNSSFFIPKVGGVVIDSGKVPTNPTVDIAGTTYAASYPIGCHQAAAVSRTPYFYTNFMTRS